MQKKNKVLTNCLSPTLSLPSPYTIHVLAIQYSALTTFSSTFSNSPSKNFPTKPINNHHLQHRKWIEKYPLEHLSIWFFNSPFTLPSHSFLSTSPPPSTSNRPSNTKQHYLTGRTTPTNYPRKHHNKNPPLYQL